MDLASNKEVTLKRLIIVDFKDAFVQTVVHTELTLG
jgi:hypothetical protein